MLLVKVGHAQAPTQNATSFTVSAFTTTSLTLTWSNVADANRTNYLILANTTGVFADPVAIPADDANLGDGSGAISVGASTTTYEWNTGLNSATVYHFKIFAYNTTGPAFLLTGPTTSRTTLAAQPANQATALSFTNLNATSYDVGFTAGASDPDGYLVIRRTGASPSNAPVDGTTYAVDDVLGDGTVEFIGAIGSVPFTDASLTAATTYHYDVYAYNGTGDAINYLGASPLEGSRITLATEPTNQPTAPVFSGIGITTLSLSYTAAVGAPDGYIIIRNSGASPTAVPVDGVTYGVNAVLGDGTVEFVGAFGTLNDAGLTANTVYHYDVFAYNGSGASINYLTTSPLEASRITWANAPGDQPTAIVFSNVTNNSLDVSFTAAPSAPDGYFAVRRSGAAPTTNPADGVDYTEGQTLGDGEVVYIGSAPNFSDGSLSAATTYYYKIYSFNGSSGSFNYLTGSAPLEGNRSTLATEPANQPTALNFTVPASTTFTVNYTAAIGSPAGYIALRRTGSSPVDVPVDGTVYTAGNTIGTSTVAFVGAAVTFNETSLTEDTQYFYDIFSFNGSGATINYNVVSPLEGSRYTIESSAPGASSTAMVFSAITNNSITVNYTNAASESRIVVVRQGSAVSFTPTDGTSYTVNGDYSAGTEVGPVGEGNKVVGSGSGPIVVTGLNGDAVYHFAVYEVNGTLGTGAENYRTTPLTGNRSTEPTTQASAIVFSSVGTTTTTVSWTNGNGDRRIVLAKQGAPVDADPVDLTNYNANPAFGSGTQIGTGNRVVYDGTGSSVPVTALTAGNVYHYAVYEYNGAGLSTAAYLTPAATASRSTLATQPSNSPNNISFASVTPTSFTVNFNANSGGSPSTGFIAVRRVGAFASTAPVDGTTYTAGEAIGNGVVVYSGAAASFNESGLDPVTNYYYRIYSFAGSGESINYKDSSPLEGNQTTPCIEPSTQASGISFSTVSEGQMQVNWTRGNGDQIAVFARNGASSNENPVNGTSYTASTTYGAGTPAIVVPSEDYFPIYVGTGVNVTVTDLNATTSYHFKAYEFNNANVCFNTTVTDGVNAASQSTTATAVAGVLTTVSAAATLSSVSNTIGTKMPILTFKVDDDGLDNSATRLTSLIFRAGTGNDIDDFRDVILGADLTDQYGNTQTTNITIAANTITITNIVSSGAGSNSSNTLGRINDEDEKNLTLNIWLKTTIGGFGSTTPMNVDGRNLSLSLDEADITYNNSGVSSSEILNGTVIQSGGANGEIDVDASAIRVTQQPSAAAIATQALATQPIFEATDVNNNRDINFGNALTVSTTNPDNLGANSPLPAFASGIADFTVSGFNFPNAGTSSMRVTANAINSAYTNSITVTSNTTVAEIFGGVNPGPTLNSSSTNVAILGFSLTTTGSNLDFTSLAASTNVDPDGKFTNIRLIHSTTNDYTTGTLTTLATGTTPGNAIDFTGFTAPINGTPTYYFIVADVEANVSALTPAITLTITPNTSNLGISGSSGVSGAAFASQSYNFDDVTAPTIASLTASADPFYDGTPLLRQTMTIVFSEAMQQCGLCAPVFNITSGNWSVFSQGWTNATTYTVVYQHNGVGQTLNPETFTVDPGNARDLNNNFLLVGGNETFVLDTRNPLSTVTTSSSSVNVGPPAALTQVVTVTYDEAMNPATSPTITFSPTNNFTSAPGAWSVGNTVWTQTFTHNGTVETQAAATAVVSNGSGATDVVGNTDVGDASPSFVIDTRPPSITSITSPTANGSYTTGANIIVRVVFNENISLSGTPTLTLNTGATATFNSAGANNIDFIYTVVGGENTADLDVTNFNLAGATIKDLNNNTANLALPINPNRLIDLRNIRIDTQAPTINEVSTSAVDGSYNTGDVIDIQVEFSENVFVNTFPQLALNSGGVANYFSGSGTTILTFRYIVAAGQNTTDLDYVNINSLTLPGTSLIRDIVNINAVLTLPAPGGVNSISDDKAITIDTVVPTISSVGISPATVLWVDGNGNNFTNATSSQTLTWIVTFSENVTGVDVTDFSLNRTTDADLTFGILGVSGSGSVYTVTLSNVQLLDASSNAQLALNVTDNNSIIDAAGNPLGGPVIGDGAFTGSIAYPADPLNDAFNDYFTIVFPEPSNAATNFNVVTQTPFNLVIDLDHPVAPLVPANYYLIQINESGLAFTDPVDGEYSPDTDLSDGTFSEVISTTTTLPYDLLNYFALTLKSGIDYDFRIISVNFSGLYNSQFLLDYRLGTVLTGTTNTTTAASATLNLLGINTTISALVDTQGEAEAQTNGNMAFVITDETVNSDSAPFKFSALTVFQGTGNDITDWTQAIDGAVLSDGTNSIVASSITNNQIIFTGIPSSGAADLGFINDASFKNYTVKIWLKSSLGGTLPANIDGLNFAFAVNNSSFAYNDTSNDQLSTTLQAAQVVQSGALNNRVNVVASQLAFRTQGTPGTPTQPQPQIGVASNFPIATAPKVYALDANNNLDLGYNESITVNNTNALAQTTTHLAFPAGGILTLSNYSLLATGTTQIRVIGTGATTVSMATSTNVTAVITNLTQITAGAAPEPATISSLSNTLVSAVDNFDFTITDDAGANGTTLEDNDGLPTRISQIRITQGVGNDGILANWNNAIASVRLSDGVNILNGVINVAGTEITFSGMNNTLASDLGYISDGASKTYRLRIVLKGPAGNPIDGSIVDDLDNKDFVFNVNQNDITILASPQSSALQASTTSSGNGNNTVEVVATRLDFTTQPNASQNYDAPINPSPVVKARDANGNLDTDYAGTPAVTSQTPATYTLANTTLTNNNGIITFDPAFNVTSAGNGPAGGITNLFVSSAGLTTAQSISFTVNYSNASDIIKDASFTYPTDIQYINHQTADITGGSGVSLERFLVRDGGLAANDTDGTETVLTGITLAINNWENLRNIALYDGGTELVEVNVATNINIITGELVLSGFEFSANDDNENDLTVKGSFLNTVGDNEVITFSVVSVTARNVTSSQFATTSPVGIVSTANGDENKLEVVATKIDFLVNPNATNISTFTNIDNPYIVLGARDANNNLDSDYTGAVGTVTNSLTLVMNNEPTGNFVAGVYDFAILAPNFQFEQDGEDLTLTVPVTTNNQLGALPTAAVSTQFDVAASFESFITAENGYELPENIPYKDYQATNIENNNSFNLLELVISDGDGDGIPGDIDGAATILNSITFSFENHETIRKIAIYDENDNELQEKDATDFVIVGADGQITFGPLLGITAPDDGRKLFRLRATFFNTPAVIIDNIPVRLSIVSATLGGGSRFYEPVVGYVAGNPPGSLTAPANRNLLEVTATRLDFTTQPASIEGIDQPLSVTPVVEARDNNGIVDLDFNFSATIENGVVPNVTSVNRSFTNGILNFTGLQYLFAGSGTYTVTSNGLSSITGGSTASSVVDVIHVTAIENTNGVVVSPNIQGGSTNVVIFGVDIKALHKTGSEPTLNGFSILFDLPYKSSSTTILKNFRVFESTTGTFAGSTNITAYGGIVTEGRSPIIDPLLSITAQDMVTITFPTPRNLNNSNSTLSYFLLVDVDPTANSNSSRLTPKVLDEGFGSLTNNLLNTTAGSSKANVTGKQYSFASKRPPILISSYPENGQLNVDPAQSTITLTFDVPVWTYDGIAKLYNREDNSLVATLTAANGRYALNEPVAGSVTNPTPLTFNIPPGTVLEADGVYYLTIEPGTFNPLTNTGTGIADDGTNLFGGISYNGTLYFKIASENPPTMITTDETKYYFTPSGGSINASFNQFGKAYFLIVDENDPVPTTAQIKNPSILSGYLGTVAASGVIEIKQIEALQHGIFTTNLIGGTTYDVWMYAENDALPQPVPTLAPFGPKNTNYGAGLGSVGNPTFKITAPPTPTSLYLNKPLYQICANSEALLADPIIIAESNVSEFNIGAQNFNIILPTGFQFDVDVQPDIVLTGTDFDPTQLQFSFLNNTLLNISFLVDANVDLDAITISNLFVIANNADVNGSIRRFAGNAIPTLAEGAVLGTIVSSAATPLSFTNSYSEANNFAAPPIEITDVVTAIPNNFNSSDRSIVRLIPEVPANDYGPSFFTGFSVTNDELSLAQTNPAFNITMVHTDMNGCVSTVAEQYTIYNSVEAIPGLATQQCIINEQFPGLSVSILPLSATILGNALNGYDLLELYADIPETAPASQTINGNDWRSLVNTIPVMQIPAIPSQPYRDYKMDYTKILNANSEALGIAENPYEKFRKLSPKGSIYYDGGSLGKIEFTGKYRSQADASSIIPIRQEVEVFVPAIPVIEIGSSNITNTIVANSKSIPVFCEAGGAIILNGYPAASTGASVGTFTLVSEDGQPIVNYPGSAFVDNGNGTSTLNPMLILGTTNVGITNGYKNLIVRYTYQENNSPCSSIGELTIRIVPNPVSQFTYESEETINTPTVDAYCEGIPLKFNASNSNIANGSISEYHWAFGDVNATGNNPNEATGIDTVHTFTQSLKYNVSLVTTSTFGCSNTSNIAVTVGSIPVADFSFEGVSSIDVTNLSDIGNKDLQSIPGVFPNTLTTTSSVFSDYTTPSGVFDITLTVTSAGGCVDEITKTVVTVPQAAPDASSAFEDTFESDANENDWIPFGTNVSWERGEAAKTTILNGSENGDNVWITNLSGAYNANEASALYSPNFDLTGLDRPIITFDLFTDLDDIDGVVLEYSTDNLNIADPAKVWSRLGSFADQESTGVEWYNKVGIAARPGDQTDGDYGWTETATGWRTAKHKLNFLDVNGQSLPLNNNTQIVFRFAIASTATLKTKDGFAIDNVRIGNGTRTVLVEGFTNSGSSDARIAAENQAINDFVSASEGVEIIKVNYHTAFPGADPFNAMNPDDPGARALYYGIADVPNARLDGSIPVGQNLMFSDWGQREFDKRILDLADANINVTLNESGLEADSIIVEFTPLIDLSTRATVLHVMVVEQEILTSLNTSIGTVPSGETQFNYVLRSMLPNAAGTKFTSLVKDGEKRVALAWAEGSAFAPEDDISVVVFLQDELTKTIYQSFIVRDLGNPKVVTAIEDPSSNSFEVYPNPADRELVITLPAIATKQTPLVMFDQMGKIVREITFEKGEQSKQIDTETLSAGVYLIKVESSAGMFMKKVVISHR
ncbi:hypothetical protein SanaruYs_00880 [Chryseotalea sanaruensis]|uniref:PKD domain-containing protein n=2 Tax=Chryseotalea sanaruensis TaxID=2482724 RepID=A0A401U4H8_9BACT|nr:hypothetical protein SanaruYs_00880 [Chryseotalea sanaruensis]